MSAVDADNLIRVSKSRVSAIPMPSTRPPSIPALQAAMREARTKQQLIEALLTFVSAYGGLSRFPSGESRIVDEWRESRARDG